LLASAIEYEAEGDIKMAIATYRKLLAAEPGNAVARVNLGTILYMRRQYQAATDMYRAAIATDPSYALAHFNLANALDEIGQPVEATRSYQVAIQLAPTYADAHYNLAILQQKMHEPHKALTHWRKYAKLDLTGVWHDYATEQVRLLSSSTFNVIGNSSKPRRTKRRAKLFIVR
jgi:tetratricopeptide (TPR) repeat protein